MPGCVMTDEVSQPGRNLGKMINSHGKAFSLGKRVRTAFSGVVERKENEAMKRSVFGMCLVLAIASTSYAQNRMFVVPAGTSPGSTTSGTDVAISPVGGGSLTVEVFTDGPGAAQEYSAQLNCQADSSIGGRPPILLIVDSPDVDSSRADHVGQFGAGFPAIDEGQCDQALACVLDTDCPGNSMCSEAGGTLCSVVSPRVSYTGLLGPIDVGGPAKYVGEAAYDIPCGAAGTYVLGLECCVGDADCDGAADAGCALDQTTLDSGNTTIDVVDAITIDIPVGDCCVGQNCTPDVSECECNMLGGSFRAGGDCSQDCECASNADCNDGNACTDDSCVGQGAPGADGQGCLFTSNFDDAVDCCDQATGNTAPIDDGNPCTADSCNPADGTNQNDPLTGPCVGDPACEDGVGCTLDNCNAGTLEFIDLNTQVCADDVDCPAPSTGCDQAAGTCVCVENPPLCLAGPDANPTSGQVCTSTGEIITIDVEMGQATEDICGAQLFLSYDPSALAFVSITPGADVDPGGSAQFNTVLFLSVDEAAGTIDYAIGDDPFNGCDDANQGPSIIAQLAFEVIGECKSLAPLCFVDHNPPTFLGTAAGAKLVPTACDGSPDVFNTCLGDLNATVGPDVTCPFDGMQVVTSDCGSKLVTITWDSEGEPGGIGVTDDCEGDLGGFEYTNDAATYAASNGPICLIEFIPGCDDDSDCPSGTCGGQVDGICDTTLDILPGDQACNSADLIAGGGTFCHGMSRIQCKATDKCKFADSCGFSIVNTAENLLTVDFELSPSMDPGNAFDPLTRCITATLSKCGDLGGEYFCTGGPLVGSACNPNNNGNPCPGQCELTNPSSFEVKSEVVLGQPDHVAGHGTFQAKVPVDNWDCLTLRDQWHTLRSSCAVSCAADGSGLIATFKGSPLIADDPANGECHWLINGNLNGDEHIDIIDFVAYLSADATPGANRLCNEDEKPDNQGNGVIHGDINGDGVTDIFDFSFIAINFFLDDKEDVCRVAVCGEPAQPVEGDGPVNSITVRQLTANGFTRAEAQAADLNNDGVVNLTDMSLHLNSNQNGAGANDIQIDSSRLQAPQQLQQSQNQSSGQFGTGFRR